MTWFREFGLWEWFFWGTFLAFYSFYLIRVVRIGKRLNTPFFSVFVKLAPRALFFILLTIALLGPSFGVAKKEVKSMGKDIMVCVDLSKSMDAFDIPPTRIEKVKFEIKKIINAFSSDRVGIVIFSSEAFMQCPLTFDQNALHLFTETINTGLVPSTGTDFAPPLRMAVKKLSEASQSSNQVTSKVIILISDGEDFGEDTEEVAQEIKDEGLKLFALGVGTEQGGKIKENNGFKTDKDGNVVVSKLNANSLRSLASMTDGDFFEISDKRNDVARLISSINKIEGQLRDTKTVDVAANKYFYFLLAAVALLVLDILISIKTIRL